MTTLLISVVSFAKDLRSSVALVIDEVTEVSVRNSLDAYSSAIRGDGKDVKLISLPVDVDPAVIRDTLKYLHQNARLEGAVLIGDIPVPMIRRAHHLATAFKM